MRRLPAALVALVATLALLVAPTWAATPGSTDAASTKSSLHHHESHDEHHHKRHHKHHRPSPATRFKVRPHHVKPGDTITVTGRCPGGDPVEIYFDKTLVASVPCTNGRFTATFTVPGNTTTRETHLVSGYSDGHFLGARRVKVRNPYPATKHDEVTVDRNTVRPGGTVTLKGSDCPDHAPVVSLDGGKVSLIVGRARSGFTAKAVIPKKTLPGRHELRAACDAGSVGTTSLQVLDPDQIVTAGARQPLGDRPGHGVATVAALLAGCALLGASLWIGRRRRA
jgi:hypothetical protein